MKWKRHIKVCNTATWSEMIQRLQSIILYDNFLSQIVWKLVIENIGSYQYYVPEILPVTFLPVTLLPVTLLSLFHPTKICYVTEHDKHNTFLENIMTEINLQFLNNFAIFFPVYN